VLQYFCIGSFRHKLQIAFKFCGGAGELAPFNKYSRKVPVREGHKDLTEAEALAKAKEVRAKVLAGAKFEDQAKAESDDVGSGENGGDLGTFGQGQMVPEFDEVVFKVPVGQVSEPIKTPFGYHLILVEERKAKAFEDVRGEVEQKIKPEMGKKAIDALKAKTTVVYDDAYFGK